MMIREARLPSRVLVHVRSHGGVFNATIGNLSAGGARLCGVPETGPQAGDVVQIEYAGLRSLAQIRWKVDDTCGVQFNEPLDRHQIESMLASRWLH